MKTRVFHIITRLDKGGSAETTLLSVSLLNQEKYDVFLAHGLSLESNMSQDEKEEVKQCLARIKAKGVKVFTIPSLVRRLSITKDFLALISIFRLLKQIRPHIIHTHTSKAGALGRLAAYLARVSIIIHTPHGNVFHGYFGPIITNIFVFVEKILSLTTDTITTLTGRERDENMEKRIAPVKKFVTIHSGIESNKFMDFSIDIKIKKRELGIPQNSHVVGIVARLVPIKGHKYLVSAASRIVKEFSKTVFVFVGDGFLQSELEKQAEDLGVRKNIIFTGWRKDVPEILYTFDILVAPSLNEGMGRVIVEGMAMGKPIVASNVGGIPDLIKDGENGILVPTKDPCAVEKAISRLIKNKSLAEELGKKGKAMVYPEFDVSTMVKKIDDLYESLLSTNCSPQRHQGLC